MIGKVKWFNDRKGYGFIIYNDDDLFVHYTQINENGYKTLYTDDKVIIGKIITTDKGYQAENVKKIKTLL